MAHIALLHTAEEHVERFADLFEELLPEAMLVHAVREDLLAKAQMLGGVSPEVAAEAEAAFEALAAQGPALILCSCSTFGPLAEAAETALGVRVVRIDRPMAEAAVAAGKRILLVVALETTLAPTQALIEEAAAQAGREVVLEVLALPEAWDAFLEGDREGYRRQIAEAVRERTGGADVVVLAQASMAPAAEDLSDLEIPVLGSPRLAVERAADIYHAAQAGKH